jgi:hypothetical protein
MEADISILRKTGHFYIALTRICDQNSHWHTAHLIAKLRLGFSLYRINGEMGPVSLRVGGLRSRSRFGDFA